MTFSLPSTSCLLKLPLVFFTFSRLSYLHHSAASVLSAPAKHHWQGKLQRIKPRKFGYDASMKTSFVCTDSGAWGEARQCHLRFRVFSTSTFHIPLEVTLISKLGSIRLRLFESRLTLTQDEALGCVRLTLFRSKDTHAYF